MTSDRRFRRDGDGDSTDGLGQDAIKSAKRTAVNPQQLIHFKFMKT